MKNKMIVIFIVILLSISGMPLVFDDVNVIADTGGDEGEYLDYQLVYDVTDYLSQIIYRSYDVENGELAKGRAFGTKGEWDAANYLNETFNIDLNITAYKERIENIPCPLFEDFFHGINLTDKLEVKEMGILLNGSDSIEGVIRPRWNLTVMGEGDIPFNKIPVKNGWFDNTFHCYNFSRLSNNFSYEDLHIYQNYGTNPFPRWSYNFFENYSIDIENNFTGFNIRDFIDFVLPRFEEYYNFNFSDLNESNIREFLPFTNNTEYFPECIGEPFVFIRRNPAFNQNPDWTSFPSCIERLLKFLAGGHHGLQIVEMALWRILYNDNCKGLILFDINNETYDHSSKGYYPLPTIFINGSIGTKINNSVNDYTLKFWVNQNWNTSVESYNVIGQINGTNTEETDIIICLYDSWWNQGTADSAIGIGMMMAMAKYMKYLKTNYDIIPKRNVKFIAFGGEEYGVRGGFYYEKAHENETIINVIDLNQLGFKQTDPRLTLNVFINSESYFGYRKEIHKIVDFSNLLDRTNNEYDFATVHTGIPIFGGWHVTSDYLPFDESEDRKNEINTFSFIKTKSLNDAAYKWKYHHRSGGNHIEGDSMKYYDYNDVNATTEMIWNVTKYLMIEPDCKFENLSYELWDKPNDGDSDNDSVNISFSMKSIMPHDRVMVKAMLYSVDHPVLLRKKVKANYIVNTSTTDGKITITLPNWFKDGEYKLKVYLYNSTGEINRESFTIFDYLDIGFFANETHEFGPFNLYPSNSKPDPPHTPDGETEVYNWNLYPYTTNTTDIDGDHLYYKWRWDTILDPVYSTWDVLNPYVSGENCTYDIGWMFPGTRDISVCAKDHVFSMDPTNWSTPLTVNVSKSDNSNGCSWSNPLLNSFSANAVAVDESTGCTGFSSDVYIEQGTRDSFSWSWDFGDGNNSYDESVSHSYSQIGNYTVNLTITYQGDMYNVSTSIMVLPCKARFNSSSDGAQPDVDIIFNDTSQGLYNFTNFTWDFDDGCVSYERNVSHCFSSEGQYNVTLTVTDAQNNTNMHYQIIYVEAVSPAIVFVDESPHTVGFGSDVTIYADFFDNQSRVNSVSVNITYPDNSFGNFSMSKNLSCPYDFEYVFNDTWQVGLYNYSIWVYDHADNCNATGLFNFSVSANATINIVTLKDTYGASEIINITDPPDPPEEYYLTGRGLTYNKYYNATSGNDVLEAYVGPVNYQDENEDWTPINQTVEILDSNHPAYSYGYRAGNNKGLYSSYFKPNVQDDWPVAFAYSKSTNPTAHVVRSKLVGVGYLDPTSGWAYEYLQSTQSSEGEINENQIIYEDVFTGIDVRWTYGNSGLKEDIIMSSAAQSVLESNPPSDFGLSNNDSYLVFITRLDYQGLTMYDSSGELLFGNVTIMENGVDFKDALGEFKCALPLGEAYEIDDPMESQMITYRIVHYDGDTYLLSGLKLADLQEMTFPVVIDPTITVYSTVSDGYIYRYNNLNYNTAWTAASGTVYDTSSYIYLGQKREPLFPFGYVYRLYRGYLFFNTSYLPSNAYISSATVSLTKGSDYSDTDFDITIQNGQPSYPHDPLQAGDYNKSCYSGNGGSFNTSSFSSGSNDITVTNHNWITKDGMTKLCLRSSRDISGISPTGNEYVIVRSANYVGTSYDPKLVVEYRNQSKIKNTGSTNISGYLYMTVEYDNDSTWELDVIVVNETTPITIDVGEQLALDQFFNGNVNTDDLTYGSGTYRVYVAFRDHDGEVLMTDDEELLEDWYELTVSLLGVKE